MNYSGYNRRSLVCQEFYTFHFKKENQATKSFLWIFLICQEGHENSYIFSHKSKLDFNKINCEKVISKLHTSTNVFILQESGTILSVWTNAKLWHGMAPQQKVQYVAEKVKYFHKIANHPFLSKPIRPVTELTTRLRQKRLKEMIASIAGLFIPHLVPKVRWA